MSTIRKKARHIAKFLDPQNVGSSIRFAGEVSQDEYVRSDGDRNVSRNVDMELSITDCNRTVTWSGYGDDAFKDMRRKITHAIKVLKRANAAIDVLEKEYNKYEAYNE